MFPHYDLLTIPLLYRTLQTSLWRRWTAVSHKSISPFCALTKNLAKANHPLIIQWYSHDPTGVYWQQEEPDFPFNHCVFHFWQRRSQLAFVSANQCGTGDAFTSKVLTRAKTITPVFACLLHGDTHIFFSLFRNYSRRKRGNSQLASQQCAGLINPLIR